MPDEIYSGGQKEGDLFQSDSLMRKIAGQIKVPGNQTVEQTQSDTVLGASMQIEQQKQDAAVLNDSIQREDDPIYKFISSKIDSASANNDDYEIDKEEASYQEMLIEMSEEKPPFGELNYDFINDKYSKLNEADNTAANISKPYSAQENLENLLKTSERHNRQIDSNSFDFRQKDITPSLVIYNLKLRRGAAWIDNLGDRIEDVPEGFEFTPNPNIEKSFPQLNKNVQEYADSISKDKTVLKNFLYDYYTANGVFPSAEETDSYFSNLVDKESYRHLVENKLAPELSEFVLSDTRLLKLLVSPKFVNGSAYEKSAYLLAEISSNPAYAGKEEETFNKLENYRYSPVDGQIAKQIADNINKSIIVKEIGVVSNDKNSNALYEPKTFAYPSAHYFNNKYNTSITDDDINEFVQTFFNPYSFTKKKDNPINSLELVQEEIIEAITDNKQSDYLSISKNKAKELLDRDYEGENGWSKDLRNSFKYGSYEMIPIVSPKIDYRESKILSQALDKQANGEKLSIAEDFAIKSLGNYNNFSAMNPESFWYEAGRRLIPQSLGFIAEFMLASSVGTAARESAETALKSFGKRMFANSADITTFHPLAIKSAARAYEHFIVRTPLTKIDDIVADVEQRMMPQNSYYFDAESQKFYNKVAYVNNDTFFEAAMKSYLEEGVGSITETLGGVIAPAIKGGIKWLSQPVINALSKRLAQPVPVVKGILDFMTTSRDFVNRSFFNFMTKWDDRFIQMPENINASRFLEEFLAKKSDNMLKAAGVHSFPAEYIEEFINNRISPIIERQQDEFYKDMGGTFLKEISQTAVALAPLVGISHVLNSPMYIKSFKHRNNADKSLFNQIKVSVQNYSSEEFIKNESGIQKAINNIKDTFLKNRAAAILENRTRFENGEIGQSALGQTYNQYLKLSLKQAANFQRIRDAIVSGKVASDTELEAKISAASIEDKEHIDSLRKEYDAYDSFLKRRETDKSFKFKYETYAQYKDAVLKRSYKIQSNLAAYINGETRILDFDSVSRALEDDSLPDYSKREIKILFEKAKLKSGETSEQSSLINFQNQDSISIGSVSFRRNDSGEYSVFIGDNEILQDDGIGENAISIIIKSQIGSIEPEAILPLYEAIKNSSLSKETKERIATEFVTNSFKNVAETHDSVTSQNFKGIISLLRAYEDIFKDASLPKIKSLINKYIYSAFKTGVYNELITKQEANDFVHNFALMLDLADTKNVSLMKAYISKVESGRGKKEAEEDFEFPENATSSVEIKSSPFSSLQNALDKIKIKDNFKFSEAVKSNETLKKIQEALGVAVDNGQITAYERNLIYEMITYLPEVLLDGINEITLNNPQFSYTEETKTIGLGTATNSVFVWSFMEELAHHIDYNIGLKIGKGTNMSEEDMKKITGSSKDTVLKSIVQYYNSLSTKQIVALSQDAEVSDPYVKKILELRKEVKTLLLIGTKIPNGVNLTDDIIDDSLGRINSFIEAGYSIQMAIYYGTSYEEFFARTLSDALISDAIKNSLKKGSTISKIINSVTNWKIRNLYAPILRRMQKNKDSFPMESISEVGLSSKLLDNAKFSDSSRKQLISYFTELADEFFGANPVFTLDEDNKPTAQTKFTERGSFIEAQDNNYINLTHSEGYTEFLYGRKDGTSFDKGNPISALYGLTGRVTPENADRINTALAVIYNAGDVVTPEVISNLSKENYALELMFILNATDKKAATRIALNSITSNSLSDDYVKSLFGDDTYNLELMFNKLFVSKELRNAPYVVREKIDTSSLSKAERGSLISRKIEEEFVRRNAWHVSDFEELDFNLDIDRPIFLLEDEEYHPHFSYRKFQYKMELKKDIKIIDLSEYQRSLYAGTPAHEHLYMHFNNPVINYISGYADIYTIKKINEIAKALNSKSKGYGDKFKKDIQYAEAVRGIEAGYLNLVSIWVKEAKNVDILEKKIVNQNAEYFEKIENMRQEMSLRYSFTSDAFKMAAYNLNSNDETVYFDATNLTPNDAGIFSSYIKNFSYGKGNLFEDIFNQYATSIDKVDFIQSLKLANEYISDSLLSVKLDQFIELFDRSMVSRNSFTLWHASPYYFDKFDMSYIGKGEGTQYEGVGMYFATSRKEISLYTGIKDIKIYDADNNEIPINLDNNEYSIARSLGYLIESERSEDEFLEPFSFSEVYDFIKNYTRNSSSLYQDYINLFDKIKLQVGDSAKIKFASFIYESIAFEGKSISDYYDDIYDFSKKVSKEFFERLKKAKPVSSLNINHILFDDKMIDGFVESGLYLAQFYRQIERVSNRFIATEFLKNAGYIGVSYPAQIDEPGSSINYVLFYPDRDASIKRVTRLAYFHGTSLANAEKIYKNKGFKRGETGLESMRGFDVSDGLDVDGIWLTQLKPIAAAYGESDKSISGVEGRVLEIDVSNVKIATNDMYKKALEDGVYIGDIDKHFKNLGYDGVEVNEDEASETLVWNYEKLVPIGVPQTVYRTKDSNGNEVWQEVGWNEYPVYEYAPDINFARFSFVGEQAIKSAKLKELLEEAKRLDSEGVSNSDVWRRTMWFKDGNDWKIEIAGGAVKPELLNTIKSMPAGFYLSLGEFYDNEALYNIFPDLRNTRVIFDVLRDGTAAESLQEVNLITVNVMVIRQISQRNLNNIFNHEIQHLVQYLSNFENVEDSRLYTSYEQYYNSRQEVEARNAAERAVEPELQSEYPLATEGRNTLKIRQVRRFSFEGNEELTRQKFEYVKSEKFKKWFGDWEKRNNEYGEPSKIVDKEGKPLLVYHGTNKDFDKFDKNFKGVNTGNTPVGQNTSMGFFFLTDKKMSSGFTASFGDGNIVIEAFLNLKKPLNLSMQGIFTSKNQSIDLIDIIFGKDIAEEMLEEFDDSYDLSDPESALQFLNDAIGIAEYNEIFNGGIIYSEESREKMIKLGYDGIISDFGKTVLEFIAFEPDAIDIISKEHFSVTSDFAEYCKDHYGRIFEYITGKPASKLVERLNQRMSESYEHNPALTERNSFYTFGSGVDISNFISFAEHAKRQGNVITPLQMKQIIDDIHNGVTVVANPLEYTRSIVSFYKDYYLRNALAKQNVNLSKKDLTYVTHTPNRKNVDGYKNDIDIIERVASDVKYRNLMISVRNELKRAKSVYQRNKHEDVDFYGSLRLLTKVNPKLFTSIVELQEFYDYLKYRPGSISNTQMKNYADDVFNRNMEEFGKANYAASDPAAVSQDDLDTMIDTIELLINSFQGRINYANQDIRDFIDIDLTRLNLEELKAFYAGVVYIVRNGTINEKIFDFTQLIRAKHLVQDFEENKQNFYLDILNEKTARSRFKDVSLGFIGGHGNIKLYGIHDLMDLIDSRMRGEYNGLFYNTIAKPMIDNSAKHDSAMNDLLNDIEAPKELSSRGAMNVLGIYALLNQKPFFDKISNKVATYLNDQLGVADFVEGESLNPFETNPLRIQAYELLRSGVMSYLRKSIIVSLGGAEEIGISKQRAKEILHQMNVASGITSFYIAYKVKKIKKYLKYETDSITDLVNHIETRQYNQTETDYIESSKRALQNVRTGQYTNGLTLDYASTNYSSVNFNEIVDYVPVIRYKDFYNMFEAEDYANARGVDVAFKLASNVNINEDFILDRVNTISGIETNLHKMVRTRADQQLFYLYNAKFGLFLKKVISSDLFRGNDADSSFNRHSAALILGKINNYFERGFSPSKLALNKVAIARYVNNGMNNLKVLYTGVIYKSLAQLTSVITNMQGLVGSTPRRMVDTMWGLKTALSYFNNKEYENFLRIASPEVYYRGIGDYDLNNSYRDALFGKYKNLIGELLNTRESNYYKEVHGSKFRKCALASVVFFDKMAAVSSWFSAYHNYLANNNLQFDINSVNEEAAAFATNVVANTQSSDNQIYRGASQQGIGIGSVDDINTYLSHEYSAWSELVRQSYFSFLGFSSSDVVQTMKNRRKFYEGIQELDGSKTLGAMQDMMYNFAGKVAFHSIRGLMFVLIGKVLSNIWDDDIDDDDYKKYLSWDTLITKALSDYLVLLAPIQKAVSSYGESTEAKIKGVDSLDYTESYKWGAGEYSPMGFYEETMNNLIRDVQSISKQAGDSSVSDEESYVYLSSLIRLSAFFGVGVPTMPETYEISEKIEKYMRER